MTQVPVGLPDLPPRFLDWREHTASVTRKSGTNLTEVVGFLPLAPANTMWVYERLVVTVTTTQGPAFVPDDYRVFVDSDLVNDAAAGSLSRLLRARVATGSPIWVYDPNQPLRIGPDSRLGVRVSGSSDIAPAARTHVLTVHAQLSSWWVD